MRALGRFQLFARLASGGLGELFAARRTSGGDVWAVQVIPPELSTDLRFARLLLTEANAAARLSHPGLAVAQEAGREGDELFVAAPLVQGQHLGALMKQARMSREPLSQRWVCHIGAVVAEALAAAHELPWFPGAPAPIVHGALAPRSIFITYHGDVALTGVGVGRARWSAPPSPARLAYAAPERLANKEPSLRTDVYGLGVVLYDALTGRRIFQRATEEETKAAIREANVPPLHAGNLQVRLEIADLLRAMMAPRVEARPDDLRMLAQLLREAAEAPSEAFRQPLAVHLASYFAEDRDNLVKKLQVAERTAVEPSRRLGGGGGEWTLDIPSPTVPSPLSGSRLPVEGGLLAADTLRDPAPRSERLGRYVLEARMSGSGPRQVYRARDPNLDRAVVVHVLDAGNVEDARLDAQEWTRLFKLEARHAARLMHPRLPNLLDAGRQDGRFFAVYRYFPGVSLAERLDAGQGLSSDEALRFASDWAQAVAALHRSGLLHGDLRATNVVLDEERGGALIDLSLAQPIEGPAHPLLRDNLLFQAPENVEGRPYTAQSEQFAFGAVLYQAVVGVRPFRSMEAAEIERALRRADVRWPEELGISVLPLVSGVLRRLLARRPEDRFTSFSDAADRLQAAAATERRPTPELSRDVAPAPETEPHAPSAEAASLAGFAGALGALAVRARGLEPDHEPSAPRTAAAVARGIRVGLEAETLAPVVAGLGVLLAREGLTPKEPRARDLVPSEARAPLVALFELLEGAGSSRGSPIAAAAWVALRYHALARPPEGQGDQSPRRAVETLRREASERQIEPTLLSALADHLRERLSALSLSEQHDERILLAGGTEGWRALIESEGFEVIQVADGHAAFSALSAGRFFGALIDVQLQGRDGRSLLRLGRTRPELRGVRFALIGGELEPEDHGPFTCAVPSPSPDAVRAVVRGWRRM